MSDQNKSLSRLATRAMERIKAIHRSTGWVITGDIFSGDEEIQRHLPAVLAELHAAGYLLQAVCLRTGESRVDEVLRGEDAEEALAALRSGGTVAHPETGCEMPARDHVVLLYETTGMVPVLPLVLPPPADPRAVALYADFRGRQQDLLDQMSPDHAAYDLSRLDELNRQQAVWAHAAALLAQAFQVKEGPVLAVRATNPALRYLPPQLRWQARRQSWLARLLRWMG